MSRPLRADTSAAWQATLGAGLLVALAVWALLEWLRRTVQGVDQAVEDVWTAGQRLAQNTQTAHLLDTTKRRGTELAAELRAAKEARG